MCIGIYFISRWGNKVVKYINQEGRSIATSITGKLPLFWAINFQFALKSYV